MPRRKKEEPLIEETPATQTDDWWTFYCVHVLGIATRKEASGVKVILDTETETALKDPLFTKFLKYGPGKTGGPATISDFLAQPMDKRKFYVNVFKKWKETIKKSGLEKEIMQLEG